jgi:hypothetical protein
MKSPVPAKAECLNLFDHIKSERWPSKYAPHAQCLRMSLVCPSCGKNRGVVPFNEQITCGCGLHMWASFGQLFIWRDDALATVPAPAIAEA